MTDALRLVDLTEDHLEDVLRVRRQSFGALGSGARDEWWKYAVKFLEDGRYVGVADGDEVVAAARFWDFEQWWGGRRVPMAGVAGVVVAPEYRGRGVGSKLMRGVLRRAAEKGFPLSGLYPATTVIYRHLGYEFGGSRYKFSFQSADLRRLGGKDVSIRRAGPDDAERFREVASRVNESRRANGPLIWPLDEIEEWLADEDNTAFLAEDGFVLYNWAGDEELGIEELIAGSERTARALWATVGSGSSTAKTVHAYLPPADPIHLMVETEAAKSAEIQRWMLRLLDAPAAIAARGFAAGAVLELDVRIEDPDVPENSGDWHLSVADGSGQLAKAQSSGDAIGVGPRGLAALYAGTSLAALRGAGLLQGGSVAADPAIEAAFAGPTPYMLDYF
ncbi:GNAT family N-acetyltransferase [Kribbella sp. NBC_01484]|uniref:GNAT family N-acetyltransferase n=1 Tax=Kribbella sp. NBC_01484 TaxID=2903579 RepID=UPI002E313F87|nr:GNAT family N-acetyltransferase [Kribbella sp. NBC_01484]